MNIDGGEKMKKLVLPIMLLLSIGSADGMWYKKGGMPRVVPVTPQAVEAVKVTRPSEALVQTEAPAEEETVEQVAVVEEAPAEVTEAPAASAQERVLMWRALPEINAPEIAPAPQAPVAKQPLRLVPVTRPAAAQPRVQEVKVEVIPAAQAAVVKQPVRLIPVAKPAAAQPRVQEVKIETIAPAQVVVAKQSVSTVAEAGPYDSAKLARAIARGDVATVRAALDAGVNASDTFKLPAFTGLTPLALAFKSNVPNKLEIAELLLVNGANVADLKSYLAEAIAKENVDEVEWLINFGVEDTDGKAAELIGRKAVE